MLERNDSCLIEQLTAIALFTVVILFILGALKSRLYFAVGKKKEDTDLLFLLFFLHPPNYFSKLYVQTFIRSRDSPLNIQSSILVVFIDATMPMLELTNG